MPRTKNKKHTEPDYPEGDQLDTETDDANDGKSIGEMLEDQEKAEVKTADQPVADIADAQIGDRLVDSTNGLGTVVSRNETALFIKHDNQLPDAEPIMYGIAFSRARLTFSASISGNDQPEAGRFITPEEIETNYQKALLAHAERSHELALGYRELKNDQTRRQQELNEVHKEIKEHVELMVAHAENKPSRERAVQREIAFDVGEPTGNGSTSPASLGFGYIVPADQTISLKESGLSLDVLHKQIIDQFYPGKKAKNIGKQAVEVRGAVYLIRQSSEDKTRWFLQALVDLDTWQQNFEGEYGQPITNWDDNAETKQDRTKGGDDCGRVVKIGRKSCVLAPESHGLVVCCSPDAVRAWIENNESDQEPELIDE